MTTKILWHQEQVGPNFVWPFSYEHTQVMMTSHKMIQLAFLLLSTILSNAFQMSSRAPTSLGPLFASRRTITKERTFDPVGLAEKEIDWMPSVAATAGLLPLTLAGQEAIAASKNIYSSGSLDPKAFVPVCPASDGVYRFLQASTSAVVGDENFVEYGPLIAGGLLRIRLELCVVESFFAEAVGPFIERNGISWILPIHETVETFLAGVIFALASTFILIGSTKIISVLALYVDLLLGLPCRILGGYLLDRSMGKPVTLDVGFGRFKTRIVGPSDEELDKIETPTNPVSLLFVALSTVAKVFGQVLKFIKDVFDGLDQFVGKNLIVWATGYILIKFAHFKLFPDFPNF